MMTYFLTARNKERIRDARTQEVCLIERIDYNTVRLQEIERKRDLPNMSSRASSIMINASPFSARNSYAFSFDMKAIKYIQACRLWYRLCYHTWMYQLNVRRANDRLNACDTTTAQSSSNNAARFCSLRRTLSFSTPH